MLEGISTLGCKLTMPKPTSYFPVFVVTVCLHVLLLESVGGVPLQLNLAIAKKTRAVYVHRQLQLKSHNAVPECVHLSTTPSVAKSTTPTTTSPTTSATTSSTTSLTTSSTTSSTTSATTSATTSITTPKIVSSTTPVLVPPTDIEVCAERFDFLDCPSNDHHFSRIQILNAFYGRVEPHVCVLSVPIENRNATDCSYGNAFTKVQAVCENQGACKITSSEAFYGVSPENDPCPTQQKYTVISYQCKADLDKESNNQALISQDTVATLACTDGATLNIVWANWGRTSLFGPLSDNQIALTRRSVFCESIYSTGIVQADCQGLSTCSFPVTDAYLLNPRSCSSSSVHKYLELRFNCELPTTVGGTTTNHQGHVTTRSPTDREKNTISRYGYNMLLNNDEEFGDNLKKNLCRKNGFGSSSMSDSSFLSESSDFSSENDDSSLEGNMSDGTESSSELLN